MARLFHRPGDSTWWLDFTDAAGRRRRVKTDTTSRRAAEDLLAELRANRRRESLGLEATTSSAISTVAQAWRLWLERWCPEASAPREWRRYRANIEKSWFGQERLTRLTGEQLERWFGEKVKAGQAPRTVNGHRTILRRVVNCLIQRRLFRGLNPVRETRPLQVPEYAYQVLTEDELHRVLPHLPGEWRDVVELAFTAGLRRGEIYALRKDRAVLDLERGILTPRASNARPMPKGRRILSIPLTPESRSVLERAWERTRPGELLFPGVDGQLRSENLRPSEALRSAMGRAGLVEGWLHTCRWRCGVQQRHDDEQQRRCPKCGRLLWPKALVRRVRFHDLRHSTANHLLDRGVPLEDVQLYLRHSTIAITAHTYRHRTVEALRKAVTSLSPEQLERHLDSLARGQPAHVQALLRETAAKLALFRHQPLARGALKPAKSNRKAR
jgi:integrase